MSKKPRAPPPARASSEVAHDLRNRLATLKLALQTIRLGEQLSDRGQRRLTLAERSLLELEELLRELLDERAPASAPRTAKSA